MPEKKRKKIKVQDLKPKKDAKGGFVMNKAITGPGGGHGVSGPGGPHGVTGPVGPRGT